MSTATSFLVQRLGGGGVGVGRDPRSCNRSVIIAGSPCKGEEADSGAGDGVGGGGGGGGHKIVRLTSVRRVKKSNYSNEIETDLGDDAAWS